MGRLGRGLGVDDPCACARVWGYSHAHVTLWLCLSVARSVASTVRFVPSHRLGVTVCLMSKDDVRYVTLMATRADGSGGLGAAWDVLM